MSETVLNEREDLTGSPVDMERPEILPYEDFDLTVPEIEDGGELIALYDYEAIDVERELSFKKDDKLKLIKRDIIEGWHLAKVNQILGIIPIAYVKFYFKEQKKVGNEDRNSIFGYKPIKKFSWFINNGIDDYLLGKENEEVIPDKDLKEDIEKHFIEHGPYWQMKTSLFSVFVHSPVTKTTKDTLKEYTTFLLTSTFDNDIEVTVERRFSQFEWLHERLSAKFRALVLPTLPEKQFTGRFSHEFIERRRRQLERYINRLARHQVIRYSELFVHFLSCTSEEEWLSEEKKLSDESKTQALNFFQNVYHPEFNVDEDGEEDLVLRFSNHVKSIEKLLPRCNESIQGFRDHLNEAGNQFRKFSFSILRLISGLGDNVTPDCINEEKVWCFKENCKDCLKLTKGLQEMAECMQSISDTYDEYTNKTFTSSIDLLKEYSNASASCSSLIEMHNIALNRSKDISNEELQDVDIELIKSRCDTVYNVTLAEINRIHDEKVRDFHTMNIDFIEQHIEFYEKSIEGLKKARECLLDPKYSLYDDGNPRELSKIKLEERDWMGFKSSNLSENN
ncbi:hypothetical protein K502DRAFT_341295 [Neoconidiobolus thromboides FSU 785]|nr:hypothetical protein K502DRAFT_341295 [Neoconidiobolus thromboides FSU 785]